LDGRKGERQQQAKGQQPGAAGGSQPDHRREDG